MKLPILGPPLILTFGLATAPSHALEIDNFRSGLLCDIDEEFSFGDVPIRWICFETEIIYVTGQGQCTYDGREEKCTWYGYEFEYSGATEDDEISCVSTSSLPGNVGNPKGVDETGVTVYEWSYKLPPGDGHHFNPQYSVAAASLDQETIRPEETVCSVDGKELYRFRTTTIFPAVTEKTVRNAFDRLIKAADEGEE